MGKRILTYALLACGLALVVGSARAQEPFDVFNRKAKRSYFVVDYAAFQSDQPGKIHLELYYQIYNNILKFERKPNFYEANYDLAVKVYGKHDELVDSYRQSKTVRVPNEIRAKSAFDYRTSQVNFDLPPGKYTINFILSDPKTREVHNQQIKVRLKELEHKKPSLSDIELAQAVDTVRDSGSTEFDKGNLMIIPSVTHVFGNNDKLRLPFYVELYQGSDSAAHVRVEVKLRQDRKGMVYRDSLTTEFTKPIMRQLREISLDSLVPGHYELSVSLMTPRRKKIAVKYRDFTVFWSQKAMLKFDYKSVLGQLAIIANHKEMKLLKKPETFEDRVKAFNAFWEGRDPTPGTVANEAKAAFYQRVNIANQNFTTVFRKGWRTDRGRIYIMYGEPDQVDDYPVVPNSHPYQEWQYFRGSKYRKFIFVDVNEDGDYRLEYPYDGLYQQPD